MSANTSATFAAWRLLERLVGEVIFPSPPVGSDPVACWFGDPASPPAEVAAARERVVVVGVVRVPGQEWGPVGDLAREERFSVPLFVESALAGRTAAEARERVEELTAAVEDAVRAVVASRFGGGAPPEMEPFPVWQIAVGGVAPMTPPGAEGAVGMAEIVIEFEARVGTRPRS